MTFTVCVIMLLSLSSCRCKRATEVKLYFPDENMDLGIETRVVDGENIAATVVEEIVKGPLQSGLTASVTGDVRVLSAEIAQGVCTVDLSGEFRTYNTGGTMTESIAIYSIVNSLCSLDGVDKVKINIEGETEAEFGGHFYLGDKFEFEVKMVRYEDRVKYSV